MKSELDINIDYVPKDQDLIDELDDMFNSQTKSKTPKNFIKQESSVAIKINPADDLEYTYQEKYPEIHALFSHDLDVAFDVAVKKLLGQREEYRKLLELMKYHDEKIVEAGSLSPGKEFTLLVGYPRKNNEETYTFSKLDTGKSGKRLKKQVRTTEGQIFLTTQLVLIKI